MNSQLNLQALVERQATAWETGDVASIIRDFAPNAIFKAAGYTFEGIDAIEKTAEDYFKKFTDIKVTIKRIIIQENMGAVEWEYRDRNRETGEGSDAEDSIIFEVEDNGKIIYWREYIENKT
ncbi:MAG: nuclear transport factor 2 family protein [Microcoleaceae cyanobacterium]